MNYISVLVTMAFQRGSLHRQFSDFVVPPALMHPTVVKHDLPTWVIGPPSGMSMDAPSDILKIWPERELLRRLSANEFNPILDQLTAKHCS